MPYIKQENRDIFDPLLESIIRGVEVAEVGDLNYIITRIVHKWIEKQGLKYKNLNAAIGVLECAKLELYRMIAAPYENGKQMENGHISELDKDS